MTARIRLTLVAALPLAACAAPSTTPTGQYRGTLTPTPLTDLCQPAKSFAQINNDVIQFAPDQGTWILEGVVSPNGTLTADKSSIGVNKQPYLTTFEGRWTPTTITGTYKTPRCTFSVALSRPA